MQRSVVVSACLVAVLLAGCASLPGSHASKAPKPEASINLEAVDGSGVTGTLAVYSITGGIHVQGSVAGLAPGSSHGIHIFQRGDCTAPNRGSAGGHFNPRGVAHGDPVGLIHHAGDMANQTADTQGIISLDVTVPDVSAGSHYNDDVLGRSLIVQAGPDDYSTQPDGGGGAALACGVILKPTKK
ncbi:MAG: superoxide dismutase family protein [Proteobacteria bacterium]|nr:superoxide dismutase family protein [Pseudomonadota bacterium]